MVKLKQQEPLIFLFCEKLNIQKISHIDIEIETYNSTQYY
jgi:hypothetical protein